jgi:hypothetical protein
MRTRSVVLLLLALLAAPATAGAQSPLPLGEDDGVRIVRERGVVVVVFTSQAKKLWRRVAGRPVTVECTEILEDGTFSGSSTERAPKRGRRIWTGDKTRKLDYCTVVLDPRGPRSELIAAIPLTQKGAVYLDKTEKAAVLSSVVSLARRLADKRGLPGFPIMDQLVGRWPRLGRLLVSLPDPASTPAAERVGYWTDGAEHIAVAMLSASGRRFFIEFEGDVLHTNVWGAAIPL